MSECIYIKNLKFVPGIVLVKTSKNGKRLRVNKSQYVEQWPVHHQLKQHPKSRVVKLCLGDLRDLAFFAVSVSVVTKTRSRWLQNGKFVKVSVSVFLLYILKNLNLKNFLRKNKSKNFRASRGPVIDP